MRRRRHLLLARLFALTLSIAMPGPAVAAVDTTAQGEINRRLTLLAFSDDGGRALLLERSGFGPTNEAVWIVDKDGVVEVLSLGLRGGPRPQGPVLRVGRRTDPDSCRAAAERLSDMAADFDQISVRVGMCGSATGEIVATMKVWAPLVPSADLGALHQRIGLAGRTFVAPRGPTRDVGPLVVVIGSDAFGNDRVGVTLQQR